MRILMINPPYQTITSNFGVGHQVPLGLLMIGGPLIDAGHEVRLLDAESCRLSIPRIVQEVAAIAPDVVMVGQAGSTPAHPITMKMLRAIKSVMPQVTTVYGGVYPTYQAEQILQTEPAVDIIVRGEGEETSCQLLAALSSPKKNLCGVPSLAFRASDGRIAMTVMGPPIRALDTYRIAWELIDNWDRYRCFGLGRAAIVQFSRGCPHRCTYCGQFDFWKRWRYRDPIKLADEIERLYHEHDVSFFTLADENPTTLRDQWQTFLEEMVRRHLPVQFFATIRATDIVRDADMLDLYRRAGILYVLMGIETTNARLIDTINKRSSTINDYRACQLLQQHGIFSIIGHIVGFEDETLADFLAARRALARYDGDHLNVMYVTPHPWTAFAREVADRRVVEDDLSRWDYRHQVLAQRRLPPWQLFAAVKWLEFCFHFRPRRIWRLLTDPNPNRRYQFRWCLLHTALVFLVETLEFVQGTTRRCLPLSVRSFYTMHESDRHAETPGLPTTVVATTDIYTPASD